MKKSNRNWFKEAVLSSKIPKLVSDFQLDILIQKAMLSSSGTFSGFEVLLSATALCKTGKKTDISNKALNMILEESEKILEMRPKSDILALNFLGSVRGLRPAWFSCPIYQNMLTPFKHEMEKFLGSSIVDIFDAVLKMSDSKRNMPLSASLKTLDPILTIEHSKITTPADLWDKLFVQLDNSSITLTYKIADVTYSAICRTLQKDIPRFGEKKGKSLEKLVKERIENFMPSNEIYHSYYIDRNEKDLMVIGKDMGIAIECKSTRIRSSSADWSRLNAVDDTRPVLDALKQLMAPLELLRDGGRFYDRNGKKRKVKPKEIVFGFVITDQIYTPYIRAGIDDILREKENPLKGAYDSWHGEEIWCGSILDFCFLLEVTLTPSVLIDYLQWIRSHQKLKYNDEPEAWLFYGTEPILPFVTKTPANILANGFNWKNARVEGLQRYRPFWLERSKLVRTLDLADRNLNAMNIIKQDRKKATRIMKQKGY